MTGVAAVVEVVDRTPALRKPEAVTINTPKAMKTLPASQRPRLRIRDRGA
jgi:hypothetical protein